MKIRIALFALSIALCSPAIAQSQLDAATKQDVEDMMQLTGTRERMQTIYSAMASQFAASFADRYKHLHPDAGPAEIQKITTAASERFGTVFKAMPTDELMDAMVPVYQKYLTHSDIKAINDFYASPTGRKLLQNLDAIMVESMQAAQAVIQKHMPEIQAQADKAAADAAKQPQ
jgi:uncharacterized protein